MDTMDPVYGSGTLLLIAAIAVAVLLVLIIALRMHAFVALVLVSFGTAIAAGVPVSDVPTIAIGAFGSTLGTVALLVGLGVMIGRLLEVTGGAQVLADTLVSRFGEKRAPLALGVAALLFGLPIFFDAGLVVFLPIIFAVAKRFGGSVLMYALPAAGAFAAMHAIVPPHPGPVTAATELGASIGLTLLVGVVVAVVAWFVGVYVVTTAWLGKVHVPINDSVLTGGRDSEAENPPSFAHVLGILLLPLVLIGANTVLTTLRTNETIAAEGGLVDAFIFIGQTPVALLIALLVATYTLAIKRYPRGEIESMLNDALGPICAIILITGAGGMFGGVLRYSGIGAALSDSLADLGLPLIVSAFVIATILRVAQGSATVA
ncbi:MAG: GntP family permease, partial [Actinobacteria bacterium]|nr:GntP family permease [Actinomycetota bacterium]